MSMQLVYPEVQSNFWRGAVSFEPVGDLWQPWRLSSDGMRTAESPELIARAAMAAGIRASLLTSATDFSIDIDAYGEPVSPLDVLVDGEFFKRIPLLAGRSSVSASLPEGHHRVDVWLPQSGEIRIGALMLEGVATSTPAPLSPFRWSTYGSSVTHCREANGPSETWPALVARNNEWELNCFGFGGQCQLDPVAATTLEETPADLISMCLGINVYNHNSFSRRSFAPQVSGFIQRVRAVHNDVPIVVMSPTVSPKRESTPNGVGFTLEEIREEINRTITTLQDLGDTQLHLVNGLEIIRPEEADLLGDGLHPTPEGYRLMAERLSPILQKYSGK